jgi:putative inorganic carbon (HCO3(-)) transporter
VGIIQEYKERSNAYRLSFLSDINLKRILYYVDTLICILLAVTIIISQYNSEISFLCLKIILFLGIIRVLLNKNLLIFDKTALYLILFFILIQILTSLASNFPKESLFFVRVRAIYFTTFFALLIFIKNVTQLKVIIISLIIFTSIISVIELYYFVNDLIVYKYYPAQYRLHVFDHPTPTAEVKMFVLLIIFPLFFVKERFLFSKIWMFILSFPIFVSFYFTYTRSAYFGFLAAIILIAFLKNRKVAIAIVLLNSGFLLFAPGSIDSRIISSFDLNYESNKAREYMLETGIKMIKDHPILGVGSANFKDIYQKYKKITIIGEGVHLHNNIMQIMVTMGAFGLLTWLALMIYIFRKQILIYKKTKGNNLLNCLTLSSIASMVAFQICGMTDWNFADYTVVTLLWFLVSLSFLSEKFLNEKSSG